MGPTVKNMMVEGWAKYRNKLVEEKKIENKWNSGVDLGEGPGGSAPFLE